MAIEKIIGGVVGIATDVVVRNFAEEVLKEVAPKAMENSDKLIAIGREVSGFVIGAVASAITEKVAEDTVTVVMGVVNGVKNRKKKLQKPEKENKESNPETEE